MKYKNKLLFRKIAMKALGTNSHKRARAGETERKSAEKWNPKPHDADHVKVVRSQPKVSQKQIDEFYDSWEWKRLSYDIKKQRGRICECCGATPEHGARIVTDHVKPLRFYWNLRLDPKNLQVLCDDCNMGKGSRDETDWRSPA